MYYKENKMPKCKVCGFRLNDGVTKCPMCGAMAGSTVAGVISENADLPHYKCLSCGELIVGEHRFCPNCGVNIKEAVQKMAEKAESELSEQKPTEIKCVQCGAILSAGVKFCNECGARQDGQTEQENGSVNSTSYTNQNEANVRAQEPIQNTQHNFSQGQRVQPNVQESVSQTQPNASTEKKDRFSFGKKFFLLLVLLGLVIPIYNSYEWYTNSSGEVVYHWVGGGAIEIIGLNEDIPYSLLLTASAICAGLAIISAIGYKIGKNDALKSLSTSVHFLGFIAFVAWVVIRTLNDLIWGSSLTGLYGQPGVYVMFAGWTLASIKFGKKNKGNYKNAKM
ncbi:MAG: zinc ribbon domain-containing protein [Treponema sp.]|nr:zinc ribbon domain-containing protein [Treponema sp.]